MALVVLIPISIREYNHNCLSSLKSDRLDKFV